MDNQMNLFSQMPDPDGKVEKKATPAANGIEQLREQKAVALKKAEALSAQYKKLYGEMDIESAMSIEEKKLYREKNEAWSEVFQWNAKIVAAKDHPTPAEEKVINPRDGKEKVNFTIGELAKNAKNIEVISERRISEEQYVKDHLTATEKKILLTMLNNGLTCGQVRNKIFFIAIKVNGYAEIVIKPTTYSIVSGKNETTTAPMIIVKYY